MQFRSRLARIDAFLRTKRGISLLVVLGAVLLGASYYLPYWDVRLTAPQYPEGLNLSVYMNHVSGDVHEVDLLNHYIGMGKLEDAAPFERHYASFGVLVLALGALLVIPMGKKAYKVFYLPPVLFLGGFVADFYFWMYRFGHVLNPDAPVHVKAFTPTLIGTGQIGQFVTFAMFGSGFWLAAFGSALILLAIGRRGPVCESCEHAPGCKVVCSVPESWVGRK